MLRVACIAVAFMLAHGSGVSGLESVAEAGTAAPVKHKKKVKRGRGKVGFAVPQDALRQEPLPRASGQVRLWNPVTKERVDVNVYNEDGSFNSDALQKVYHILRCRRTDDEKPIDPRLVAILSHVTDHFRGKEIEIVSGYRNQRKTTSHHFDGSASDIRLAGVTGHELKRFLETLDTGNMGIGVYPRSGFVHVDVREPPSYRWTDYARPGSNEREKRPPKAWKRHKLQS